MQHRSRGRGQATSLLRAERDPATHRGDVCLRPRTSHFVDGGTAGRRAVGAVLTCVRLGAPRAMSRASMMRSRMASRPACVRERAPSLVDYGTSAAGEGLGGIVEVVGTTGEALGKLEAGAAVAMASGWETGAVVMATGVAPGDGDCVAAGLAACDGTDVAAGLATIDATGVAAGLATIDTTGVVAGLATDDTTGVAAGLATDDSTGVAAGLATDDRPDVVAGLATDDATGVVVGLAAGDGAGVVAG